MKAMVYTGPLRLELQHLPEPELADGDVLVEVDAAGICGSELEGFRSQSRFRVPPLVMGHELAEPVANAIHAWRLALAHDPGPARVGVVGAGMLGLASALVAARGGVRDVCIADLSEDRRASAAGAGLHAVSALEGEFDVVFDAVGSAQTRTASVERLRPGGTAVWIGLHGPDPGFDGLGFIRSEKRILATFAYLERDFEEALRMVADLRDTPWVASRPLDEGVEAFHELLAGATTATKTLLRPR